MSDFEEYDSDDFDDSSDLDTDDDSESFDNTNAQVINIYLWPHYYNNYPFYSNAFAQNPVYQFMPNQSPIFPPNPYGFQYPYRNLFRKKPKKTHKHHKHHHHHHHRESSEEQKTKTKPNPLASKINQIPIPYTDNGLKGIFDYLTNKTNGDIHENGTITIRGSSNQPGHNYVHLCNFHDFSRKSMWSPDNEVNANILVDFKDRKVKLTHYSFRTPSESTLDYPKSWKVELSNDSVSWDLADSRENQRVMSSKNVLHTFRCDAQIDNFYRYVRITSTGPCWSKDNRFYFDLAAIEFFGFLIE